MNYKVICSEKHTFLKIYDEYNVFSWTAKQQKSNNPTTLKFLFIRNLTPSTVA